MRQCKHDNAHTWTNTLVVGAQFSIARMFAWCTDCGALKLMSIDTRDPKHRELARFLGQWHLPERQNDTALDRHYDGVGALVRALRENEHELGRPEGAEAVFRCVERALELLDPAIAAEVCEDGAARVYAERWGDGGREAHMPRPRGN